MAESRTKKLVRKVDFTGVHKLKAGVCLITFFVVLASGLKAQVSIMTILMRATLAVMFIVLVSRIVIQMLATYEEIHGGKGD